jgi:hypothetical protein
LPFPGPGHHVAVNKMVKVSDDGNLGSLWRWSAWGIRVDRSRRARINGRLGEHVVVERDRLVIAAFCVARSPFFRLPFAWAVGMSRAFGGRLCGVWRAFVWAAAWAGERPSPSRMPVAMPAASRRNSRRSAEWHSRTISANPSSWGGFSMATVSGCSAS